MQLGMHFRLTDDEVAPVLAAEGDDSALARAVARLEEDEAVFARGCETDKAWDPIACALSPGGDDGPWPARGVIGGARALQEDDDEAWVTHLSPDEAAVVSAFLAALTDDEFSDRYRAMPAELRNPEYGPDELRYALANLDDLRTFFAAARLAREHVVFTVWG